MGDIQKPSMPSLSSSEMQSVVEEGTNRSELIAKTKQAAKTMRNFPLSATDSQVQEPRINTKIDPEYQRQQTHQYEANTFSSQYSLSHNQTAYAGARIDDEHLDY